MLNEHLDSLPTWHGGGPVPTDAPWLVLFVGLPAAATFALCRVGIGLDDAAAGALLAGVGVLAGLLFQVLAWVAGRIGGIADQMGDREPTPGAMDLLGRLDIARSNIAYAAAVSVLFAMVLGGAVALADNPAGWLSALIVFLFFHLSATLLLVLVRINSIGRSDRIDALTARARAHSSD